VSRSYRLPFYYYVCCGPIGRDRIRAARGVRHKHNQQLYKELRTQQSRDHINDGDAALTNFLLADIHECHWNNRWSWSCDASRPVLAKPTLSNRDLTDIGIYMNADPEGVSKVFGGRGRDNAHWLEYHLKDLGRRFQFWKKKQRK
jgi:hypothetical protein